MNKILEVQYGTPSLGEVHCPDGEYEGYWEGCALSTFSHGLICATERLLPQRIPSFK